MSRPGGSRQGKATLQPSKAHLYLPVQQLSAQNFKGAFAGQTSQSAEESTGAGVPDHVARVADVQNLKIVVDRVTDDNFAV